MLTYVYIVCGQGENYQRLIGFNHIRYSRLVDHLSRCTVGVSLNRLSRYTSFYTYCVAPKRMSQVETSLVSSTFVNTLVATYRVNT